LRCGICPEEPAQSLLTGGRESDPAVAHREPAPGASLALLYRDQPDVFASAVAVLAFE